MKHSNRLIHVIVFAILLLSQFAPMSLMSVQAANGPPRAYPGLLQVARDKPNEKVRVIVQRYRGKGLSDRVIQNSGGFRKKDLPMINGMVMELPARAVEALSRNPAVRWISLDVPLFPSSTGSSNARDEFSQISYNGNFGAVPWTGNWAESGESDGPNQGYVRVVSTYNCLSGGCLRLKENGVSRTVNLKGAASATLSFSYRRNSNGDPGPMVSCQVSIDSGVTWSTLKTYPMLDDWDWQAEVIDLTPYISANTQIRFLASSFLSGTFFVDNVDVAYDYPISEFVREIGADRLKDEAGLDGQGVTVAVIDSGISENSDLQGANGSRVIASATFGNHPDANDANGHGTHVAGILAGNGNSSNGELPWCCAGRKSSECQGQQRGWGELYLRPGGEHPVGLR